MTAARRKKSASSVTITALLRFDKRKLDIIAGASQAGINRGRHINAVSTQRGGNVGIDVLVEMKANPFSHRLAS